MGRTSSGARPLWSARYLRMLRASAGSWLTLLRLTIRLMVFSQFSGLARRYEMRVIRILSSTLWQLPQRERTSSLCTGMPSSAAGVAAGAAGGGCAAAALTKAQNTIRNQASRFPMSRFTMSSPRDLLGHLHLPGGNRDRRHALRGATVA